MDHALVSSPDAVPGRITLRATARIEQPAAQHRGDAQVTALVRGGLNPCLPCVRSNKLCPFPHPLGDEALPSPLHGFTDEFGQALEGSARGERQFSLCPAHGAPWSAQGGAHLGQRRVVSRQDVPTEEAEMDEVEASLGKERGGNIVDLVREKGDLCQTISIGQRIGGFHLKFVFVDADTLEIGILPRHCAQPFPGSAANFQDRLGAR